MGDICPKCGKDTFEVTIDAPFETDPHQEGKCHNPDCNARGRLDILQLQADVVQLKQQFKAEDKDVSEKEGRNDKTNQDGNGRRGKHKL